MTLLPTILEQGWDPAAFHRDCNPEVLDAPKHGELIVRTADCL